MSSFRSLFTRICGSAPTRECTRADGYDEAELLHFAHDHLASAEILFERSPSCHDSAGNLTQISIELTMKAALLHHHGRFPAVHDLRRLRGRLLHAIPGLRFTKEEREIINRVDRWHPLRYPKPGGSESLSGPHFPAAKALAFRLLELLPSELRGEFTSTLQKGDRVLVRWPKGGSGAV
jgi:HEPN domain-containing protein